MNRQEGKGVIRNLVWYKKGLTELLTELDTAQSCNTPAPASDIKCYVLTVIFSEKAGGACALARLWLQLAHEEHLFIQAPRQFPGSAVAPFIVLKVLVHQEQSSGGVRKAVLMTKSCLAKNHKIKAEEECFKNP